MGNILGNGLNTSKPKGSMNKAGFYDKVVQSVAKTSDDVMHTANPNTVSINSSSGNNICIGNILNHGPVPRASHKLVEEPRNGPIKLDNPEEIKNAGNEMYKKGNFSEAVALYEKSIAMCPNHAAYRSNRAAALIGLGRLGEAVQECEEAIRLDPQYSRAQQRASHLYVRYDVLFIYFSHVLACVPILLLLSYCSVC
jgi:tetratricopeptide (TPR) repeat protein